MTLGGRISSRGPATAHCTRTKTWIYFLQKFIKFYTFQIVLIAQVLLYCITINNNNMSMLNGIGAMTIYYNKLPRHLTSYRTIVRGCGLRVYYIDCPVQD